MTDQIEFQRIFNEFRRIDYPDYPAFRELQDWNSHLLTLDAHVAGYASQICSGLMKARDVPELGRLVKKAASLKKALVEVRAVSERDLGQIREYRDYILALESVLTGMRVLALEEDQRS